MKESLVRPLHQYRAGIEVPEPVLCLDCGKDTTYNAVRARMYLKGVRPEDGEPPDNDLRVMEFMKNQYGSLSRAIVLRFRDGMFLAEPEAGVSTPERAAREARAEGVFLKLLRRYTDHHTPVSPNQFAQTYTPTVFAKEAEAKDNGVTKKDLEDALTRPLEKKTVSVDEWGPPSRRCGYLVIA
jgi:hypothetical protein